MQTNLSSPFEQSIKALLAKFDIDAPDILISDLVLDSRDVAIHKAFIALHGHSLDGRDFIPQAVSLGAKVILAQCDEAQLHGHMDMREQSLIISFYRLAEHLSALAAAFYHYPAEKMDVVAVTGTNGKTSTVQLSTQLAQLLGHKAASIGTLGAGLYHQGQTQPSLDCTLNTTPDGISMQRLLADFALQNTQQVALEASSHALVQQRIAALKCDVAVFTNLSRDHLDYHTSMSAYAQAKRSLLQQPGLSYVVLIGDDKEHENWLKAMPPGVKPVLFGLNICPDPLPENYLFCRAENIIYLDNGCRFSLNSSWGRCELHINLLGQFNVANVVAAIAVQLCLAKSLPQIAELCSQLSPVPGRMELFAAEEQATLVVDYAHTPDALQQALIALRFHCNGQLWCVFGCGGDRDRGKRSLMGEVAENYADRVIITNDNSRNEAPLNIANEILAGCLNPEDVLVELDRRKAIQVAHGLAQAGDIILVAGKGHEDYQIVGTDTLTYDERAFVRQQQKQRKVQ